MPEHNAGWGLSDAVGLTDAGTQCRNVGFDQQQVGELLDAVGTPAGGTPLDVLPPIESGFASPELCEAIRTFQTVQSGLIPDARVDVDKNTWRRLIALGAPSVAPPGGVPVMLSVSTLDVVELPPTASGLPSVSYTVKGPVATYVAPGIRIELSASGPLNVSWGSTFPVACQMSTELAALESAVASGAARTMGGAALNTLSKQFKVESAHAVHGLFTNISVNLGSDGTPVMGGSIGDGTHFQSVSANPVERSITYSTTQPIATSRPVTGGDVQITGSLTLSLKVTAVDEKFEASVVAGLIAIAAAGIVLFPVAELLGAIEVSAAAAEASAAAAAFVKHLILRLAPAAAL